MTLILTNQKKQLLREKYLMRGINKQEHDYSFFSPYTCLMRAYRIYKKRIFMILIFEKYMFYLLIEWYVLINIYISNQYHLSLYNLMLRNLCRQAIVWNFCKRSIKLNIYILTYQLICLFAGRKEKQLSPT